MGVIENVKKRGLKDILNLKKWWIYIRSWFLDKFNLLPASYDNGLAYCEMVVYRSLQCPECVKAGKCIGCGCPVPEAILDPINECSEGNWEAVDSFEEWEKFKQITNLKFKAEHE